MLLKNHEISYGNDESKLTTDIVSKGRVIEFDNNGRYLVKLKN